MKSQALTKAMVLGGEGRRALSWSPGQVAGACVPGAAALILSLLFKFTFPACILNVNKSGFHKLALLLLGFRNIYL